MMKSRQCLWVRAYENPAGYAHLVLVDVHGIRYCSASGFAVTVEGGQVPLRDIPHRFCLIIADKDAFVSGCIQAGFTPLAIENRHVLAVGGLKRKDGEPPHNDPFDRILIAQARTEEMTMITHDTLLAGYGEKCVLTI